MIRAIYVHPDTVAPAVEEDADGRQVQTAPVPCVSQQQLVNEVLAAVSTLHMAGGILTVTVGREPTGYPHERVTSWAQIRYDDKPDARASVERDVPAPLAEEQPAEMAKVGGYEYDVGDGEVDESSLPPHLREG